MLVIPEARGAASCFVSSSSARSALSVLGLALVSATFAGEAMADDTKRACVDASTDAQTLRKADKLIEARDKLRFCASSACPEVVRSRCTRWLSDLDAEIPSVIVRAKDAAGSDIFEIDVMIDGRTNTAGRQEMLDPGEHIVVVKRPGGQSKEEKFLLVDGERARVLTVYLGERAPARPAGGGPPEHGADDANEGHGGGIPAGTWVLGGLGLVAFGGAVFFYAQAASDLNQLRTSCSPNCSSSQTQPVLVNADLSYVSIGLGVVALGGAIAWALLDHPSKTSKSAVHVPAFDVRPVAGGALTTLGFHF
jgi:hypothetical protein